MKRPVRVGHWLACAAGILALNTEAAAGIVHTIEPVARLGAAWSPEPAAAAAVQSTSAEADIGFADGALISGAPSEAGPATVSSAQFLTPDLLGFEVDYPGIKLRRSLRADHALLGHRSDRAESAGTRDLLNAAILALSSEVVSRQAPR